MQTVPILAESGLSECGRTSECAQDVNTEMAVFFGIVVGVPLLLAVAVIMFFLIRILPRRR
ncbi:hypothetical protein FK268_11340 [Tsukamurella sputi]|uniref:Uncharacterized protein n=1 Tax=Tsukamurella sputi TaxID=2591848 RepID=A0A5C5RNY4_9ACTN|nr:hypothetical protein [Tsukamurella sputi]TWS24193.1 hypothetical protein FK268_11340 [Tsukamurella sputi]